MNTQTNAVVLSPARLRSRLKYLGRPKPTRTQDDPAHQGAYQDGVKDALTIVHDFERDLKKIK
jgi:hypothetical protein